MTHTDKQVAEAFFDLVQDKEANFLASVEHLAELVEDRAKDVAQDPNGYTEREHAYWSEQAADMRWLRSRMQQPMKRGRDYGSLPECARGPLERYVREGLHPGSGYAEILSNRLTAVLAIDDETLFALPKIVRWLVNHAPAECWGSAEAFEGWLRRERRAA